MTDRHDLDDFYPDADTLEAIRTAFLKRSQKATAPSTIGDKIEPDFDDYRRMTPEEREAFENRPVHPVVTDDEFEFAFASQCSLVADEWGRKPNITDMERAEGAVRGVLEVMDGKLGTVFPQVMVFTCKHGTNDCNVLRDGTVINSVTDRTTHFYGGGSYVFNTLRQAAAELQVKEGGDE